MPEFKELYEDEVFAAEEVEGEGASSEKHFFGHEEKNYLKEKVRELTQNIDERKRYANRLFLFLVVWSSFLLVIFLACGLSWLRFSDKILITLLSVTTVNIIGLFMVVINYLFPKKVFKK